MPRNEPPIWEDDLDLHARAEQERAKSRKAKPNGQHPPEDWTAPDPETLTLAYWLSRDLPEPDFILGEVVSTTTRMLIVAPTGLGKTHFGMAKGIAASAGANFLHWRGGGKPRRVLYIDGEMSRRLLKTRLADATRRFGAIPDTFFALSREDVPDMPPLNTEAGQKFINQLVESVGGVDLIIFDNIQSLLAGDMKDEEPWQQTLPWVRDLTARAVGQIWIHHTGHDETHSYGTKTREWQLDTVAIFERLERPEADIAFKIKFTKARERAPHNRTDFEPAIITLVDDRWSSERGEHVQTKQTTRDRAFELLRDAITRDGKIPPASEHIPPNTICVSEELWRSYCAQGCISEGSPDAFRMAFKRAAEKLIKHGQIGKWGTWCWIVR